MKNKEKRHHKKSGKLNKHEENPKKQARVIANSTLIEEGLRAQREKAEKARQEAEQTVQTSHAEQLCTSNNTIQIALEQLNRSEPFPAFPPDSTTFFSPYNGLGYSLSHVLQTRELGLYNNTYYRYKSRLLLKNRHLLLGSIHPIYLPIHQPTTRQPIPIPIHSHNHLNICAYGPTGAVITTPRQAYVYEGPYTCNPYTIPLPYNVYGVLQTSVGICAPSITTSLSSDLMYTLPHTYTHTDIHSDMHTDVHIQTQTQTHTPYQINIATLYNRSSFQHHSQSANHLDSCRVDVCMYHPHTYTHHTIPFLYQYGDMVDHTSILQWNKLVDSFHITSSHAIHTTNFASQRTYTYALPSHTHTHISAYSNDDLTTHRNNTSTAFIGMRNGSIHHVDFRQRGQASGYGYGNGVLGYKHSSSKVNYSVYGIHTLKDHQICVNDISNQVYILDIRHTRSHLRTLQHPCHAKTSRLVKAGVYVSMSRDLIITQHCASPLQLAYYSVSGRELLGVHGVSVYDSAMYYGSMQFASPTVYGDGYDGRYGGGGMGGGEIFWGSYARTGGDNSIHDAR
ncbi:hypothetical protein EON63_11380, partial [archaeon]